jgi:acyl-CoA dehydrogenase
MNFESSVKSQNYLARLKTFMNESVFPIEQDIIDENNCLNESPDWHTWQVSSQIEPLKIKAKKAGLWNLFLPDADLAKGLTCLEYAPLAEQMGRSLIAPDTGNMEVLYHFGNDAQKAQWLTPLLKGEIRSVFGMTEPDVASSDATNMEATIEADGDELVLNGKKWWTTGLGHPNAKLAIFMGLSNPDNEKYNQHSMVIVPLDSNGVTITRMLSACGEYDAPYGHGEMELTNVRVSKENLIMGLGEGFAIAQGRLGPGRIHHCMRAIGAAERSLELMIKRGLSRTAFGKPIIKLGGNLERVAQARMAIDQARLLTLHAAWKIDTVGVKHAMTEISSIKVVVPNMLQRVSDMAIQMFGGAGVSSDYPVASFNAMGRILRLADGPDEVHMAMVSRLELRKYT